MKNAYMYFLVYVLLRASLLWEYLLTKVQSKVFPEPAPAIKARRNHSLSPCKVKATTAQSAVQWQNCGENSTEPQFIQRSACVAATVSIKLLSVLDSASVQDCDFDDSVRNL